LPQSPTFDAVAIAETAAQLRLAHPVAAKLIEDLWSEVQRLSAPEYVAPVPITENDRVGPFRGKPEVDVEFFNVAGDSCGSSTVGLGLRINDRGILIISDTRVGFTAPRRMTLGGYRVWVGSDMLEAKIDPVPLARGDTYLLALNLPIRIGRDIGHDPGRDHGPPRPNPPLPQSDKLRQEN
jgi:hypothetical protein